MDASSTPSRQRQRWDAFLVLDVEGTCETGTTFSYPNEIIEWPVVLLRWTDKQGDGTASKLEVVDEFRTFIRPTWRPQLTEFCTTLTGITQDKVDGAPTFPEAMDDCAKWLSSHGLVNLATGERLVKFCWCTDGPWDLRDFLIKQLFISKMQMPWFLEGSVFNVRNAVDTLFGVSAASEIQRVKRLSLNIERQLQILGLPPFKGRQHSGIDDARNIARILSALAEKGMELKPQLVINPRRRWPWMGKRGKILEEYAVPTSSLLGRP